MPLEGSLKEFNLFEVLSLLKVAGKTGKLVVNLSNGKSGEIYILDGKPIHAVFGNNMGEDALLKMVKERDGTFLFTLGAVTTEKTIMTDTEELISRIEEKEKELQTLIDQIGDIHKYLAFNTNINDDMLLTMEEWLFLPKAFSGKPIYQIAETFEKGELAAYEIIVELLKKNAVVVSSKPTILSIEGEPIKVTPSARTTSTPSQTASVKTQPVQVTDSKKSTPAATQTPSTSQTTTGATSGQLTRPLKAKVKLKAYMSTTGTEVCWVDSTLLEEWQSILGAPVTMVEIQAPSGKKSKVPVKTEEGIGDTIYLLPITSFRLRLSDDDVVQVTPIKG
ncbi:MAG: DUF4388 domain-containing protein [Dictyoglomi bacterium]|nr:DUF4388 domain-containing protein [Dictyoglomota bacterium]